MSEKKIRLDEAMPVIRERLSAGYEVTFSPRGTSMLPFLKEGRDSVVLASPPKKLAKYDIPLYQRKNGQYVLHRVVRVGKTYTCIGDNQFIVEKGIEESQIIAVCSAFVRKGKRRSARAFRYRFYALIWHHTRLPRRLCAALWRRLSRLWKA